MPRIKPKHQKWTPLYEAFKPNNQEGNMNKMLPPQMAFQMLPPKEAMTNHLPPKVQKGESRAYLSVYREGSNATVRVRLSTALVREVWPKAAEQGMRVVAIQGRAPYNRWIVLKPGPEGFKVGSTGALHVNVSKVFNITSGIDTSELEYTVRGEELYLYIPDALVPAMRKA